ncbi:hypothetical protein HZA76_03705 [Candidatus Roizmanbacteria bacterium]|nr:hypothetical protein [Candidatus Roizmanbacteria bacterium]
MSKKTKKEKIIAAYRKQLRHLRESQPVLPIKKDSPVVVAKVVTQPKQTLPNYFFVDFKKSLIFIVLIIALEIALYFVKLLK